MLMMKLVATMLAAAAAHPEIAPGRHSMTFRQSANVYAVVGEGTFRTKDCTVTAEGLDTVFTKPDRRGRVWVTFLDRDGEYEAQCEVDELPPRHPLPVARLLIRRQVATVDGR